jgi:hypothetical protein
VRGYVLGGDSLYDPSGLEAVLDEKMGKIILNQTLKPLLVNSYDIYNNESRFFKNWEAKTDTKEKYSAMDNAAPDALNYWDNLTQKVNLTA